MEDQTSIDGSNQHMSECVFLIWAKFWKMKSIMIILKINVITIQEYYSLTLIIWCMRVEPEMFVRILVRIEKCLILLIIQLNLRIKMIQTN